MAQRYHLSAPNTGPNPVPLQPLSMRPAVAARALGISPRKLWSLTKQGLIPHVRLGRCVVYSVAALQKWMEEQTVNPIDRRPDVVSGDKGKGVSV